jgi:hypothetical protein
MKCLWRVCASQGAATIQLEMSMEFLEKIIATQFGMKG